MGNLVARARVQMARAVGARAGSMVEPLGLAGERYDAAVAPQCWCSGRDGSGVSRLR